MKEESSKTYSCLAYFIGKTMLEIPLAILFPLIYASIGYWMTGLDKTFPQFIVFGTIFILFSNNIDGYDADWKWSWIDVRLPI